MKMNPCITMLVLSLSLPTRLCLGAPYFINPGQNIDYHVNYLGQPGDEFVVAAGSFTTTGLVLKAGQRLRGAGMNSTLIVLAKSTYSFNGHLTVVTTAAGADNVEVSDLTADANSRTNPYPANKRLAVTSLGNNTKFLRLRATRTYGILSAGEECFSIKVANAVDGYGTVIEGCVLDNVVGDYHSGIGCHGSGVIRSNRVYFPLISSFDQTRGFGAYNCEDARGLQVTDNYSEGGCVGYYTDWGNVTNLTVANNVFTNCLIGVNMGFNNSNGWGANTLYFSGNKIYIARNITLSANPNFNWTYGFVLRQYYGGAIQNITLVGNQVRMAGGGNPPPGYSLRDVEFAGVAGGFVGPASVYGCTFTIGGVGEPFLGSNASIPGWYMNTDQNNMEILYPF